MNNPHQGKPHIFFNKKYIGLKHQNVTVNPPPYTYHGGRGIDGCLNHLNNINSVLGSVLIMVTSLTSMFGFQPKHIFSGGDSDIEDFPKPTKNPQFFDNGLKDLVSNVSTTLGTLEKDYKTSKVLLENMHLRLQSLEQKLGSLDSLQNSIQGIDLQKIEQILTVVQNIDQKV